jgi:hypothetical protein
MILLQLASAELCKRSTTLCWVYKTLQLYLWFQIYTEHIPCALFHVKQHFPNKPIIREKLPLMWYISTVLIKVISSWATRLASAISSSFVRDFRSLCICFSLFLFSLLFFLLAWFFFLSIYSFPFFRPVFLNYFVFIYFSTSFFPVCAINFVPNTLYFCSYILQYLFLVHFSFDPPDPNFPLVLMLCSTSSNFLSTLPLFLFVKSTWFVLQMPEFITLSFCSLYTHACSPRPYVFPVF